jgi:hypothetical protein
MFRGLLAAFGALAASAMMPANALAAGQAVTLEVVRRITDLEQRPLAGLPARLVFGSDAGWQGGASGRRLVTDSRGEACSTGNVTLDSRDRKVPTNFVTSVLSGKQKTDHLLIGAELEYAGFRWLYTIDL